MSEPRWSQGLHPDPDWPSDDAKADILREVERRAFEDGYTELRFNPKTLGWAYHKPDQTGVVNGTIYVRRSGQEYPLPGRVA